MAGAVHIAEVIAAVRRRILTIAPLFDPVSLNVEIGNPAQFHPRVTLDNHLVTIFVYRIKHDHAAMLSNPDKGLAVQLKVLITAFGGQPQGVTESIGTVELRILSHITRLFVENPVLGPIKAPETLPLGDVAAFVTEGITVESQHLELDMEEINHIWTTQGETPFRTSLSYVFRYGLVLPEHPGAEGPPVLYTTSNVRPDMPPMIVAPQLSYGVLAIRSLTASGPRLDATLTQVSGGSASEVRLSLLLVAAGADDFDLLLSRLDPADGRWVPVAGIAPAQIRSVPRGGIDPSALPAGTPVRFADVDLSDGETAVFRVSARHPSVPDAWRLGAVTVILTPGGVMDTRVSSPQTRNQALAAEMDRIEMLCDAVARHRDGKTLSQAVRNRLTETQAQVGAQRGTGIFADLLRGLGGIDADIAIDCLMIVAYPLVRPSRARRLAALSGGVGDGVVTQALLHELLMPDDPHEARLAQALAPTAPLMQAGLLRAEGQGPGRVLQPGFALARFVAGTETCLNPPDAVRLVHQPGDPLRPMLHPPRIWLRLDEIAALIALVGAGGSGMAGPSVLFTGGPGTGKTLSVYHLAERLRRPLYQVDLGRVVSKWMGETERNLSRVFEGMSGTEGIILIDEADALLGKRVEVRESRDQHANVTVSHLLSLLERHRGPVFATTNLSGNLDKAYIRRFSAVLDFHRPNHAIRVQLWADALIAADIGKHRAAGLAADAAHAELSAAEIANAVVVAQALAQMAQGRLGPAEVTRAIMLEKTKGDLTFTAEDLGPLAPYWPKGAQT